MRPVSGFCGLVYQVVWLRLAMAAFGVTAPLVSPGSTPRRRSPRQAAALADPGERLCYPLRAPRGLSQLFAVA